ncbi:MAG: hypothetical protein QM673_07055 [Gordonia sp. (in: high G+C Gram-positive bacteria)]
MSKKQSHKKSAGQQGRKRQIRIRSQLRHEPDHGRIARTVVEIALAQAEKEAQAEAEQRPSRRGDQP